MIVFLFQLYLFGVIAILALDVFYIMNDLERGSQIILPLQDNDRQGTGVSFPDLFWAFTNEHTHSCYL